MINGIFNNMKSERSCTATTEAFTLYVLRMRCIDWLNIQHGTYFDIAKCLGS